MILLFDIGNTNITLGIADEKIIDSYRFESQINKTGDEYYLSMKEIFNEYPVTGAIISSVVPLLTSRIKKMVIEHLHITPLIVGDKLKTGIEIHAVNPKETGADLVCDAVGAYNKFQKSTIIIDLGTANKILYIQKNILKGCIILPGVKTSLKALVNNTALLPNIEMSIPKKVLGTNTIEAMQSGATYGVAASLDGLVKRIKQEIDEDFVLVATGGLSRLIIPLCDEEYHLEPNLVLEGLLSIYNKNII